jgi:alpha-tubulin suppressor-like RCC1 family protein
MSPQMIDRTLRKLSLAAALGSLGSLAACGEEDPVAPASEMAPGGQAADAAAPLTFREISTGGYSCGVTTMDLAYCWGAGLLGDGTNSIQERPVAVSGGLRFRQLSVGSQHACGVTTDDIAYCWGDNDAGQLGNGGQNSCGGPNPPCPVPDADRRTPVRVLGGLRFLQVDAGTWHTCGVTTGNKVYCWGGDVYGQLGDAAKGQDIYRTRTAPVPIIGALKFRQVSAGGIHTCGVTTDNRAFCWGGNLTGQIGDGVDMRVRRKPAAVAGGLRFSSISAGGEQQGGGSTCAVTPAGKAYCWGDNTSGQLGDGTTGRRSTPRAVRGGLTFAKVSVGDTQTCGSTPQNVAYCWGSNFYGGIGDGTTTRRLAPVKVIGGLSLAGIAAGQLYACGVTPPGLGFCWGLNEYGTLGDGTRINRTRPRPVIGPS